MTQSTVTPPYTLQDDEKAVQVMVYTQATLYWGEVVLKNIIRASTWLRTNSAPDRVTLYNVKALSILTPTPPRPSVYTELNVAVTQILAWHMAPPNNDPLDYDSTEPNRKMEPVTLLVTTFRMDGTLRLSSRSSMGKFLEVTRENFTGLYDTKITNVLIPSFGPINVPFLRNKECSSATPRGLDG